MICLVTFWSGVGCLASAAVVAVGATMTTAARLVTATIMTLTTSTITSVSVLSVQ